MTADFPKRVLDLDSDLDFLVPICLLVMSNFVGGKNKREAPSDAPSEGMAGRDSLGRRVWDKAYFKAKYEGEGGGKSARIVGPATETLKSREVDLEGELNQRRIVTNSSSKAQQGGFYCQACDCLLLDSAGYLDHINGRTHNKVLGMSMNVEEVPVERVIARMMLIRQGMRNPEKTLQPS